MKQPCHCFCSTLAAVLGVVIMLRVPLCAQPLIGGPFVLVGAPAAGGTSEGGNYRISGCVASAGAGTSSGANFDLTGGLIGVIPATGGTVVLNVELTPEGNVRIWWPTHLTGYQLQSTTTLGPGAIWESVTPAPTSNEHVTPPLQPARFYRLRQQ